MNLIGGKFGLEDFRELVERPLPFLQGNHILLASGRCGIRLLVDLLRPANVWLPSYLCEVMLQAVQPTQSRLNFYEIDYDLQLPALDWLEGVQAGDLVVGIAYFGFPVAAGLAAQVKRRGAWFLEDDSQALLSQHSQAQVDFRLYSVRKFFGVPDGAILAASDPSFEFPAGLPPPPARWWLQSLQAALLRREFDRRGGDREWFRLGQLVESATPSLPCRMSELSQRMFGFAFDLQLMSSRRIRNYKVLLERLGRLALFPDLPEGVVPLGFPLRLESRQAVRQELFRHDIYPIVHWPLRGWVPASYKDSHRLSRHILTLICDQRYGADDMRRTIAVLENLGCA